MKAIKYMIGKLSVRRWPAFIKQRTVFYQISINKTRIVNITIALNPPLIYFNNIINWSQHFVASINKRVVESFRRFCKWFWKSRTFGRFYCLTSYNFYDLALEATTCPQRSPQLIFFRMCVTQSLLPQLKVRHIQRILHIFNPPLPVLPLYNNWLDLHDNKYLGRASRHVNYTTHPYPARSYLIRWL